MRLRRLAVVGLLVAGGALGLVARRGIKARERLEVTLEDGALLELRTPEGEALRAAARDVLDAARS